MEGDEPPRYAAIRSGGRIQTGAEAGQAGVSVEGHRWARLSSLEAARIADLQSVVADLESALERCQQMLVLSEQDSLGQDEQVNVLVDALWEAALIAYRRAFTQGAPAMKVKGHRRRRKLTEAELGFSAEEDQFHRRMMALANQHIAHRVSPAGESVQIAALINTVTRQRVGVATLRARSLGQRDLPPALLHHVQRLLARIAEVANAELQALNESLPKEWPS